MSEAIAAGWYPDPDDRGTSDRYWDGTDWTERTRPAHRPEAAPRAAATVRAPEAAPQLVPHASAPAETTEGGPFGIPTAAATSQGTRPNAPRAAPTSGKRHSRLLTPNAEGQ